jgi:biotin/methionine sulfoxide reductase
MNRTTKTASHWGVYDVETTEAGDVVGTRPSAVDRNPSAFVGSLPEMVRSRLRINRPYVRAGYLRDRNGPRARGAEPFVPVSWETALDLVASELRRRNLRPGNGSRRPRLCSSTRSTTERRFGSPVSTLA